MDQLLKPEGDVVAEHRASVAWRIVSVLLLAIPAATWLTAAWSGPRENVAALSIPGAVLIALCVLVFVQQGKVRVVLRTDGVERWGLRGELWTLRWEDATELRYQATRVHAVGLDLMLLLSLFPALGKSVNERAATRSWFVPHVLRRDEALPALGRGEGQRRRREAQDPPERQDLRIRRLRPGQGAERLSLREALRVGAARERCRRAGEGRAARRYTERRLSMTERVRAGRRGAQYFWW